MDLYSIERGTGSGTMDQIEIYENIVHEHMGLESGFSIMTPLLPQKKRGKTSIFITTYFIIQVLILELPGQAALWQADSMTL